MNTADSTPQSVQLRLRFPNREAFANVFRRHLKKGELFFCTEQLLPTGSAVEVHLIPAGSPGLLLSGEVVLVIDPDKSKSSGTPTGMGVRFSPISDGIKNIMACFADGTIETLSLEAQCPAAEKPTNLAPPCLDNHNLNKGSQPSDGKKTDEKSPDNGGKHETKPPKDKETGKNSSEECCQDEKSLVKEIRHFKSSIERRHKSYYAVFGLTHEAPLENIKGKYQEFCKRFHPDRHLRLGNPEQIAELTRLFEELQSIYQALVNPERRVAYDIGMGHIDMKYSTEPEEEARKELFQEYRDQYVHQFPDRVQKAARYRQLANEAIAKNQKKNACNLLKLAMSLDPLNEECRSTLEKLCNDKADK